MATKEFITLDGLSRYHELISQVISDGDADSIKSISVSGNTVNFYKNSTATGTPAYTVNMPDISSFMSKISSATGGKIVTSTSAGQVSESATAISDLATNAFVGSLPQGAESTTVVDYIGEAIKDAADDYMPKGSEWNGDNIAITNSDGIVSESTVGISDLANSIAATDGFDGDHTIADAIDGFSDNIANKIDLISSPTGDEIVVSDPTGNVVESGLAISDIAKQSDLDNYIQKAGWDEGGHVVTTSADGKLDQLSTRLGHWNTSGSSEIIVITGYMTSAPAENNIPVFGTGNNQGDLIRDSEVSIYDVSASLAATAGFDGSNTIVDAIDAKMDKISDANGDRVIISNSDGSGNVSESVWTIGAKNNVGSGAVVTGYFHGEEVQTGEIIVVDASADIGNSGLAIGDVSDSVAATAGFDENNTIADALADKIDKISSPTGGKIATTTAQGGVAESATAISDLATNAFVGSIPQGATATTVVGYIDEAVAEAEDDSEITLVEAQTPTTGYLKTYELYQGGNAAANLVGKIDIPKDLVVTSGEIVVNPTGQPAGTYLKLTIANQTTPVYINVADLADVYTAQQSAAQVQLAISATNEISATIVAGSVTATELASNAVTTAKIADGAVTADKVAISAHTESKTAGADGLAFSVTTTDGQVSAVTGSIASGTYASAAQGALADTALQPSDIGEVSTSDIEALFS